MARPVFVTAISIFMALCLAGSASAAPVSEATVERACGDKIQSGCAGSKCAMGCEIKEGGNLVSYGCTFPNKTGNTKASCHRTVLRTDPSSGNNIVRQSPSILKAD